MAVAKKLDWQIWSKKPLDGSGEIPFFDVGGPPTADHSINQNFVIDTTALFTMLVFQLNMMKTDGSLFVQADVALLNLFIKSAFITFKKNGEEQVWQGAVSNILKSLMTNATGDFNMEGSISGQRKFNAIGDMQAPELPGGQAISVLLKWPTTPPLTFAGLTAEMVIYGKLDRTIATQPAR